MWWSAGFSFSRKFEQRAEILTGYWLESALSFLTGLPLHITVAFIQVGTQEGGRRGGWERQRVSNMKVTVFYEFILEGISHHILHILLLRKQVKEPGPHSRWNDFTGLWILGVGQNMLSKVDLTRFCSLLNIIQWLNRQIILQWHWWDRKQHSIHFIIPSQFYFLL